MRLFSSQTYRTEAVGTQYRSPQLPAQHPPPDAMPVRDCKTKYAAGSVTRQYVHFRFRLRGDKRSYPFLNELVGTNQYLWNAALAQVKKSFSVDVSAGSRFIKNIFLQ